MKINVKKHICFIVIIGFVLSLSSGCGSQDEDVQRYAWPLATASPEDTVTNIFAQKFADEVSVLSNGKMKIQVYPNSTLGGDRELLESCESGDIPFVVQNTAPQVAFMPEISIFDLPCAFDNIKDARGAVDNPVFYNLIENVYIRSGYRVLGFADQGFRVTTSNRKIENIDDFKGLKIRTMENPNHIRFWKALGSNPTPMSFNEVYVGLQQGTIDAQENPYEVIASGRLHEQQKYILETNHIPHYISLIVSDKFYNELSADQQKIVDKAAKIARDFARNASDERIEKKTEDITAEGIQIINISPELRYDLQKSAESVYVDIINQSGNEIYNAYTKTD
ncbi:TRAP transporter substrate-binding protein [Proteocatella sphenisci]|uniref:TRAP transporter substrate-binding protein n=1 Tax=Proteocatella sphenisci TaxID=181070 RepID=UPI00048C7A35|nr:TRAP transporter substrate-binding protein [Proteocatella sphenisci]